MYIKFDSLNRFEQPLMVLCNPGSTYQNGSPTYTIGILIDTSDEELVLNFNTTSELNLVVHKIDNRDTVAENSHAAFLYGEIKKRKLIFVNGVGYFSIVDIEDDFDEGGNRCKKIRAESIESELQHKKVPYIKNGTYRFSKPGRGGAETNGIIERLISSVPLWTIGEIAPSVAEKYRTFEDVDFSSNILGFMLEEVQDAYECIILFDTINRIINVYDQNDYVKRTNIHITMEDLIMNAQIAEEDDDLYTAISVLGENELGIASVNPLGTNVIYDFSNYFDWMSSELGAKTKVWQEAVVAAKPEYSTTSSQYYAKQGALSNQKLEMGKLEAQITMYRRCRDNIVAESNTDLVESYNKVIVSNGGTPIEIKEDIKQTLSHVDNLTALAESEYENARIVSVRIEEEVTQLRTQLDTIHDSLAFENNFTPAEFEELQNYIFEGSYSDEYVTITDKMNYDERFEQMETLYKRAQSVLEKASHPSQKFDLDVENFIFLKEFEKWSNQLEVGCLINVELEKDDIAMLFLSNITVNYDDRTLSLRFGNRFRRFDPKALFENVLGKIDKSANTLGYIKDTIYPIKNGEFNKVKEAMENSRTISMGKALTSDGEDIVIDDSGLTGKRKLKDGSFDPRQIKLNGKTIVFTDDAWETCKVAIGEIILGENASVYGVNAEAIIGDIIVGNNLHILNKEGKDIFTVTDDKIAAALGAVDGRLTDIEASAGNVEIRISKLENGGMAPSEVVTSTGYRFNQDGLTINKKGEEMTNLLDNTGMYVKRADTIILEANNEGVIAINLTAKQYLHVGKYSRFEDYGNDSDDKRTACFFADNK